MTDQMQLAVNHAVNDLRLARAREALIRPGMGLDAKRNAAWCEYGFKNDLDFQDFYNLYCRGGLAHGAINKLTGTCWKTAPWIIQGEEQDNADQQTPWERSLKPLLMGGRMWRAFMETDRRRLIGRYAGLLLHVRDNKPWSEPVAGKGRGISKFTPAWAGSLTPVEFDANEQSESYGEPTMWQYVEATVNGRAGRSLRVHPDRVFILGDWSSGAIGYLEPAYNAFVSLEKVEGGSGESFLKNAARQLSVSFDKEIDLNGIASLYGVELSELHKKFNEAARDINQGNDVMLINQGATVSPLVASVPDPTPVYSINLQTASAALDIPSKILVGMQTGERASSEDQKYWLARCQSRRENDLNFDIHGFIGHLMRIGVIKLIPEYTVMWDDLTDASQGDKLANAKVMSDINSVSLAMGMPAFEINEIREAAGYEPLEEEIPLPDDEDDDGESADPAEEPE